MMAKCNATYTVEWSECGAMVRETEPAEERVGRRGGTMEIVGERRKVPSRKFPLVLGEYGLSFHMMHSLLLHVNTSSRSFR